MIDSCSREAAGAWAVIGMLALAPACGDSNSPDGGGSAASSGAGTTGGAGTTTSTATSVGSGESSSASTGAGGGGGEGGGEGGEGGGGGFESTCAPPPRRIAAGDDFTCALAADGSGACRGGAFGEGWLPIILAGDRSPATCLDAVVAQGAVACVHVVADEGCPDEGFYCASDDPLDGWLPFDGLDDAAWLAVTDDQVCGIDAEGASDCAGPSAPPDLGESGPLGGISGGPHDACAWSDAGIVCWGDTPSLAANVPEFPGCVGDIDVGPGFACVTYTGFDIVDCWGELPRDISPRVFMPAPGADVAVGDSFMCALTTADIVKCWGDSARGALGVEGLDASVSGVEPEWPDAEPAPAAIAAGSEHVALLTTDGAVLAWGANDAAQICDCEATVTTPVDAGYPEP